MDCCNYTSAFEIVVKFARTAKLKNGTWIIIINVFILEKKIHTYIHTKNPFWQIICNLLHRTISKYMLNKILLFFKLYDFTLGSAYYYILFLSLIFIHILMFWHEKLFFIVSIPTCAFEQYIRKRFENTPYCLFWEAD